VGAWFENLPFGNLAPESSQEPTKVLSCRKFLVAKCEAAAVGKNFLIPHINLPRIECRQTEENKTRNFNYFCFCFFSRRRIKFWRESARVTKSTPNHRNLCTRRSMFALVQKTFWRKKPCKKSADLHPRQGNLLQRNIFTGLNQTSLYNTK
jgi:hypothetical protein